MSTRFSQYLDAETLAWLVDELEGYAQYTWDSHISHENWKYANYVKEDLIPLRAMNSDIKAGFGLYVKEFEMLDDMCERYGYSYELDRVVELFNLRPVGQRATVTFNGVVI